MNPSTEPAEIEPAAPLTTEGEPPTIAASPEPEPEPIFEPPMKVASKPAIKKPKSITLVGQHRDRKHSLNRFKQSAVVNHHDQVHDVLAKYHLPTDNSVTLLAKDGTALDADAMAYDAVEDGATVTVAGQ